MGPKRLVIIGAGATADIAHEYFTYDSDYEVVGFSVERDYLDKSKLRGLPVVAFDELEKAFDPSCHSFYAAVTFTQQNRVRARLYAAAKQKGFTPASYVSSHAFVARSAVIGEHCFIFENNVVQPFVEIGDDVTLWSGNHIGHHSSIGSHTFVSSHVVVSGYGKIGKYCFLGVNTTIIHNVTIGNDCLIGAGSLILSDVPDGAKVVGKWHVKKEKD